MAMDEAPSSAMNDVPMQDLSNHVITSPNQLVSKVDQARIKAD
jgi:hypothetical protein